MGKRNRKRKRRRGGIFKDMPAPYVTNWSGTYLDPICRQYVKIGDIVRVVFDNYNIRYLEIVSLSKKYLLGRINDPYKGGLGYCCNECNNYCLEIDKEHIYGCNGELSNDCDYHICSKCYKDDKAKDHPHTISDIKLIQNRGLITFKRSSILEIPNWSKNTKDFVLRFPHSNNLHRMFTGLSYKMFGE